MHPSGQRSSRVTECAADDVERAETSTSTTSRPWRGAAAITPTTCKCSAADATGPRVRVSLVRLGNFLGNRWGTKPRNRLPKRETAPQGYM
jgi:hypothetical protein